jgi:hypothetical protein
MRLKRLKALLGVIGRNDEPEMMPVVLAAFGEAFAVRLVSGCIEQFALRPITSHPVALEISNMGAQRARRAHLAHDPRFDDGAAGAVVEQPRGGKARGAAASKRAAAPPAGPRETASLLRSLECLRQERFGTSRACRADAAWTDAKIVVSSHIGLTGCRKLNGENALLNIARCVRYRAMFGECLKFLLSSARPTARTLRALSCPPRSLVPSAQFPSCRLPRKRSELRQDALSVIAITPQMVGA